MQIYHIARAGERVVCGEYLPNATGPDLIKKDRSLQPLESMRQGHALLYDKLLYVLQSQERAFKDVQVSVMSLLVVGVH